MKTKAKFIFLFIFLFTFIMSVNLAVAADFWDIIDFGVTKTSAQHYTIDATFYGARATGSWYNADDDGNFNAGDTLTAPIKLYDRQGNLVLETPATVTNRAELETWAETNATQIYNGIFPTGVSEILGESDSGILVSQTFGTKIFQRVMPKKKKAKEKEKKKTKPATLDDNFGGAIEYLDLKTDGSDGNAYSMVLGYDSEPEDGLSFGFLLPYRYTNMDDSINTNAHLLSLDLFLKYPVVKWKGLTWNLGVDLIGTLLYSSSDAIEHSGSLQYGGGGFTSVSYDLELFAVSAGVEYKISKAYLPSSFISDDDNIFLNKAVDYVNDLQAVQTVSYGANIGIPFLKMFAVNLEAIRSNFISSDIPSDRKSQTLVGVNLSFFPTESFEINLGVRKTYELQDIDSQGIVFGAMYSF